MKMAASAVYQDRITRLWIIFGLAIPLMVCAARAVPLLIDLGIPYDTEHVYLPLAKMIQNDFLSLWNNELMLKTAPGAYLYMALMQANMETIKTGNLLLSMGITVLLFDSLRRMAGYGAGALAAWLYVLSPVLLFWTVYPMGEPVFLFLVTLWLWACVWATHLDVKYRRQRWLAVAIGGTALAAATLTRGTYMYGIPVAALIFLIISWRKPNESFWRLLALIHIIAFILVSAYIVRSQIDFGKPVIAAGAGNALYYGLNPIYRGEEPPYYGAVYDEFFVLGPAAQLSLAADERQTAVVTQIIKDTPWPQLLSLVLHKVEILLIFSTSHLQNYMERGWRIALLCFALAGFWLTRRNPITWLISGAFLYQWAIHVPVLYNPRYSVAALDIPLTFLAALGGWSTFQKFKTKGLIALLIITSFAILMGAYHQRHSDKLLPDLQSAEVTSLIKASPSQLEVYGLTQSPLQQQATSISNKFSIEWQLESFILSDDMFLKIDNLLIDKSCKKLWIAAIKTNNEILETSISLKGLKSGGDFIWGLIHLGKNKDPSKSIRLTFECKNNTHIAFNKLQLINTGTGYRYRNFHSKD